MKNLLFTVMASIAIGGCAPITPLRNADIDIPSWQPEEKNNYGQCVMPECPDDAPFVVLDQEDKPNSYPIPIGIIEFDDQGVLQNRKTKDEIMNRIRALTTETSHALTVVFAHGWQNNASHENKNLDKFQEMLKEIAETDRKVCKDAGCEGRKVVGVYLAWRGMSAKLEPFKSMSFWNRKRVAERVGQNGVTEVLADLAEIRTGKPQSKVILIGHSFGGALIYSATQQLLMRDAASADHEKDKDKNWIKGGNGKWVYKSVPRTIANLVILVNPAFEAGRFTSLHDKAETMNFPEIQSAIIAIFTSETDKATKWAFPLGRRLSSLFTKYNASRFPHESKLDRTAVGHYPGYQTHELTLLNEKFPFASPGDSVCEWQLFAKFERSPGAKTDWDLGRVTLKRNDRVKELSKGKELIKVKDEEMYYGQHMIPYYNVVVDKGIIPDHSGIWEPMFFKEFIPRFIAAQDRPYKYSSHGPRVPVAKCPFD